MKVINDQVQLTLPVEQAHDLMLTLPYLLAHMLEERERLTDMATNGVFALAMINEQLIPDHEQYFQYSKQLQPVLK